MSVFIAIDGPDGTGKTTITGYIKKYLNDLNIPNEVITSFSRSNFTRRMRQFLIDGVIENKTSECMLFAAIWRDLNEAVIIPALKDNKVVVIDRYIASTLTYQRQATQAEAILNIACMTKPTLTLCLVGSYETAVQRLNVRQTDTGDALERECLKNFDLYTEMFKTYTAKHSESSVQIDVTKSLDEVLVACHAAVTSHLIANGVLGAINYVE